MKSIKNDKRNSLKLTLAAFIFLLNINFSFAVQRVQIIPQPQEITYGKGVFLLDKSVKIMASSGLENEVDFLSDIVEKGFSKATQLTLENRKIHLKKDKSLKQSLGEEGYRLQVEKKQIIISAATPSGIFYGIQSLRQLLPPAFEYLNTSETVEIPILKIIDKPRFPWRAFMLDESRHFKGKETVKNLLDQMALLKMNTFHWHLTDDQGWRIEIKKYPKLTEIGSERKDTQLSKNSEERIGKPHSGFYTQEELQYIIAYAQSKHIKIVPEIEMPGHATAAIASYPWVGAMGVPQEVSVTFGKLKDSFNVADPNVVNFLKDILDEVMALFPGEVLHIGGDEVDFKTWEESVEVQKFMREKNMESPLDLQVYFTNQISNYIDKSGKRMMGWNEIMGSDIHNTPDKAKVQAKQKLAKSAIIHFWKGDLKLINMAVEEGYDVVNSNHWDTYLDYNYDRLPISKSYAFDPVPEGLDEQFQEHILGTGTQMWSEWIPKASQLEQQVFPRLAAYAEVGWTLPLHKNFEQFQQNLNNIKERWRLEGINLYEEK
jgi:hexosaminidase